VEDTLGSGRFGMAEETGRLLNDAITRGVDAGLGLGQAVCRFLAESQPPFSSCASRSAGITADNESGYCFRIFRISAATVIGPRLP